MQLKGYLFQPQLIKTSEGSLQLLKKPLHKWEFFFWLKPILTAKKLIEYMKLKKINSTRCEYHYVIRS